jgi:hypothetical protein
VLPRAPCTAGGRRVPAPHLRGLLQQGGAGRQRRKAGQGLVRGRIVGLLGGFGYALRTYSAVRRC